MTDRQDDSLKKRLNKHPHLKNRIVQLLEIVENADGDLKKADEAEKRVIEELRKMGNEVLHDWAVCREKQEAEALNKKGLVKNGKKNNLAYKLWGNICF
ncbi:MAG: hypothetical protein KKC46_07840 [Proteobacteria bacterium]|nr:hypothetical protein [Pseudomonadota bacterium]